MSTPTEPGYYWATWKATCEREIVEARGQKRFEIFVINREYSEPVDSFTDFNGPLVVHPHGIQAFYSLPHGTHPQAGKPLTVAIGPAIRGSVQK